MISNPEMAERIQCGISITFDCQDDSVIGVVQSGRHHIIVSLNPRNPVVKTKDPEIITVLACALLVLDDEWDKQNRQRVLPGTEPEGAIHDFSKLLQLIKERRAAADGAA
jgi:hypothetical protein